MKKTKFSTITAALATIAAIAAMGSIGGGMGLGQQQMALAQPVDPRDIGGDEGGLVGVDEGNKVRDVLGDDDDGRQRLCPGQIFIRPNICVDALPDLSDVVGIPNVGSDDDDRDPELQLCPGQIFIPPRFGGPRCEDFRDIIATLLPG